MNNSDEEIALRVQKGDQASFGVLVERYEAKMYRYGRKFIAGMEDIQDIVQDVFVKAYVNIKSFDSTRKFSSWLYRIAHNEFVNALKKTSRRPFLYLDTDTLLPHLVAEDRTDTVATDGETKIAMEKCLTLLTPKYREPLILYYYEELSYLEIADILHIPIATVGVRLNRGKRELKSIYKEKYGAYE